MSKTIYLVRHGQTFFNYYHKVQGRVDSPLTVLGQMQAKVTGDFFRKKRIKFDKAFCSTQERACDTLEFITQKSIPYERLKDMREKWYGIYEGQDEVTLPWNHGSGVVDPNMEADFLAIERMKRAIEYIKNQLSDGEIAIAVGHGAILGMYVRDMFPKTNFHFENCGVVKLIFNGDEIEFGGSYWPAKDLK